MIVWGYRDRFVGKILFFDLVGNDKDVCLLN